MLVPLVPGEPGTFSHFKCLIMRGQGLIQKWLHWFSNKFCYRNGSLCFVDERYSLISVYYDCNYFKATACRLKGQIFIAFLMSITIQFH